MNRNHKKNSRRGSHLKKVNRKRQEKLLSQKRPKLNIVKVIQLILIVAFAFVLYLTLSTKEDFKDINNSLDRITNTLDEINNKQTDLETKQNELEEKQKALETAKAEKKAKEEAEEKAKQEAIKVAQAKKTQVSSRGSTTRATGTKAEYQAYAKDLCLNTYGWSEYDFECLVKLWNRESGWNPNAHNKSSGAHGIPQSLPASKMASEGADYYTNAKTQIRWGLKYIKNRYGTPAKAWAHSEKVNWY